MKGGRLGEAELTEEGLLGDRLVHILIGSVEGLAERSWPGFQLRIGEPWSPSRLRPRCVMTTYDPDTQEQDHSVLRPVLVDFWAEWCAPCTEH